MKGEYRVKHPDMKVLYDEAQDLIHQFDAATIEHNLRHKNELADKLANLAMDRKRDVTDANANESPLDAPAAGRDEGGRPLRLPEVRRARSTSRTPSPSGRTSSSRSSASAGRR